MAAIITEKFKLHNAPQFYESFSEAALTAYYLMIGKATPFTSATSGGTDDSPPAPVDDVTSELYAWDQAVALKNNAITKTSDPSPKIFFIINYPITKILGTILAQFSLKNLTFQFKLFANNATKSQGTWQQNAPLFFTNFAV